MEKRNEIQSKMISFLRFPMMVLIVCIHADFYQMVNHPVLGDITIRLLVGSIARIAVPLFFFISGFLFFYNVDFSAVAFREKLKRRVRSLLVPYLIWNGAVFIVLSLLHPEIVFVDDHSLFQKILTFLSAFYNYHGTNGPISFQFWFIRDLMILNIVSSILYCVIKSSFGKALVISLLFLWLFIGNDIMHQFNLVSLSFYSLGAWLAVNRMELDDIVRRFGKIPFLFFGLAIFDVFFPDVCHGMIHNVCLLFGVLLALRLSYIAVTKEGYIENAFLPTASFFLFAFHDPWCFAINKRILSHFGLASGLSAYFVMIVMTVLLTLLVYHILCRMFPKAIKVLNGNRCYE